MRPPTRELKPLFEGYGRLPGAFDEFFSDEGKPRHGVTSVVNRMDALGRDAFKTLRKLADAAFVNGGVTFTVYSDQRGTEKIFPFDLIPRVIPASDWERVERGLVQRVSALNLFLADIYGKQKILAENAILRDIVLQSPEYCPQAEGIKPTNGVYVHIAGIDLVRGGSGEFLVLEDNLRTPSGVSYVLENRNVMKRVFPHLFAALPVRSVQEYPAELRRGLGQAAPRAARKGGPKVVLLTPGPFNSAYFEHSFLARCMGVDLVEPSDLFVHQDRVFEKTTNGAQRVDVIYRRVDDTFIDPDVFRADSLLGVRGLFRAYAAGNVALANAVGNGIADDKAVYPFVPEIIRFYLSEEPIIGQVPTYVCAHDDECEQVLSDLKRLVVKEVNGSGGYGMLFGPRATRTEIEEYAQRIRSNPRGFIAQPLVELSTCPTWTRSGVAPRRVDLRPFVITGKASWVLPGGLTRVALKRGSYVVNSSQGGGSKDTWVLESRGS